MTSLTANNRGPSRTALATAYARAFHYVSDEPKILRDDLAHRLLGVVENEVLERETATLGGSTDPQWQRTRRFIVVSRARFAEDVIARELSDGPGQVVILGAGLDTFGYRNTMPDLTVFEVDHPATQAWKRTHLDKAGIAVPPSLHFVPVDFEVDTLSESLAKAGYDRTLPTVFVWLGVTMYLTESAIAATLDDVAAHEGPAWLMLDYLPPPAAVDAASLGERAARVAAVGEPWISYFTPESIDELLRRHGLEILDDRSAPDLLSGYGADVSWGPNPPAPVHVLCARRQR